MAGDNDQTLVGFDKFCGGDLWDVNLTWNAPNITWPQFTPCFQETVLQWIPCGFLWITLPITLIWMFSGRATPLKRSKLRIAKTLVGLILVLLAVVEIILAATGNIYDDPNRSVPLSWYITPVIKLLTFLLSIILIHTERKLGFITSGFQFIFYLLTVLTGIIPFYSNIFYLQGQGLGAEESNAPIIMFYVEFLFVFILWILHFPAETLPQEEYGVTVTSPCPEILSSFISRITYWWINTLVLTGYRKSLEESDIWDLNPRDKCAKIVPEFDVEWRKEVRRVKQINNERLTPKERQREYYQANVLSHNSNEKTPLLSTSNGKDNSYSSNTDIKTVLPSSDEPVMETKKKEASLFKVMAKLYGFTLFQAFMCKFFYDLLQFVNPMILNLLIAFTEDKSMPTWKGYVYMMGMFVTSIVSSAMFHQNFFIGMTLGMRIKAAVIAAVYKKALTMDNEARKTSTVGEIVNLMSVDAQRLQDLTGYLWMLWSAPVQISLAMTLLYFQMGPAVFAGLGVMVVLLPINAIIAIKTRKYQVEQMKQKDNRIKLMNEVLNGIKVLKLYAWELSFQEKIAEIRQKELDVLRKAAYLGAFSTFAWTCAPFLVTLASFMAYILSDPENHLDATTAFVSLTLFNILRFPINLLPMMISYVVMAQVSIGRIGKFLRCGDLDLDSVDHNQSSSYPITIDNGTFAWDRTERICLKKYIISFII